MKILRIILGFFIAPIDYGIESPNPFELFLFMWVTYMLFFGFIMGNCGVLKYWSKFIQRIFNIKYKTNGQWTDDMLHSFSVWSHPILVIHEKEYKFSVAKMGGNLYNEEDNLRRKAILYWLFT